MWSSPLLLACICGTTQMLSHGHRFQLFILCLITCKGDLHRQLASLEFSEDSESSLKSLPGSMTPSKKDLIADSSSSPVSMASIWSSFGSSIFSSEDKHVDRFSAIRALSVWFLALGVCCIADSASLVCSSTATSLRPASCLVAVSTFSTLTCSFPAFELGSLAFHFLGMLGCLEFFCLLMCNPYMWASLMTSWAGLEEDGDMAK
jgi:hypothetical protein